MKTLKFTLISTALFSVNAFADGISEQQCLALKTAEIAGTQIQQAEWSDGTIVKDAMSAFTGGSVNEQQAQPHCVVSGEIGARTGADGKHYGTRFQLRLSRQWNNKFLFQGGDENKAESFECRD